jgi:hypothetical protein
MTVQGEMVLALINAGVPINKITRRGLPTITVADDDSAILIDGGLNWSGEFWVVARDCGNDADPARLYEGESRDDAIKAVIRALGQ